MARVFEVFGEVSQRGVRWLSMFVGRERDGMSGQVRLIVVDGGPCLLWWLGSGGGAEPVYCDDCPTWLLREVVDLVRGRRPRKKPPEGRGQ